MASRPLEKTLSSESEVDEAFVYIYDRRHGDASERKISTGGLFSYADFKDRVVEAFDISPTATFVITTTNREPVSSDETWDLVNDGETLYILNNVTQDLPAPAHERVNYQPHYDTIVKGGMYEYYASEGQNPLPYAFAELIDNALAATAENAGPRNIELRLHFDDATPSKSCILVVDNGKGMTPRQLNNWAIYRLSKFSRRDPRGKLISEEEPPEPAEVPRSLNSDISYFGVGGKQAIFFIGSSTRMISKPKNSKDIHELSISKEEFERKEKNKEAIYTGFIRNRKPGDFSHINTEEESIKQAIQEEVNKESFTTVVIQGINPEHIPYLKSQMKQWTRQLAHIYHYYIHGPNGNQSFSDTGKRTPSPFMNIDIEIKIFTQAKLAPRVINLRDIADDMQSLYIESAQSTFEFKAIQEGTGVVEGIMRYHPFLYDRETYPCDTNDARFEPEPEDDHDYAIDLRPARGKRAVFECYWNGRLIPYTTIEEFEWCSVPKKIKNIPVECYNRVSGVLFTNDKFQVSTNKLTFIDLEMRLRDKNTAFSRVISGHEKRTTIEREFFNWLKECHEKCDKQVRFSGFEGCITRPELPKQKQSPWAVYTEIEWDGKIFKKGMLVRSTRTVPSLYGTVNRFLLYGDHDGEVFATGGDIEIIQEPQSLYDDVRVLPLSKLDRTARSELIQKYIDEEEMKLPFQIVVNWPDGNMIKEGEKRAAGQIIGAIKAEISNRKGEYISKLPGTSAKKLLVELKIVWHSPKGDQQIVSHISQYGKNWGYWFKHMENIKNLGNHTLTLQVVLNESGNNVYAGKNLPSYSITFIVTEAPPNKFTVGLLDGPFRVGTGFQIPLEFQDEFGHPTKPNSKLCKPTLDANGLELSYEGVQQKGNTLLLKNVKAKGNVPSSQGKNYSLTVTVPELEKNAQTLKIRLLPGLPESLHVLPEGETVVENGNPVTFEVQVLDCAENIAAHPKLTAVCKFTGPGGPPSYSVDCSQTGQGRLTGEAIQVKDMVGDHQILTAKIELQGNKEIKPIERSIKVLPSHKAAKLELWYTNPSQEVVLIKNGQDVVADAGQYITGLEFRLVDEAHRAIKIDSQLAGKIKANWVPKLSKEMVQKGCLPDIKVPNSVADLKFCHINVNDGGGLEYSFTIKPQPGEATQLKAKCSGSNQVRLGEVLESHILVTLKDKHGNDIQKMYPGILKDLTVTGEGLNLENSLRALGQNCNFDIRGIQFENVKPGSREICVKWKELTDFVSIEILAGKPAKLDIPKWNLEQPIVMFSGSKFQKPLIVQLCDKEGNPSQEEGVKCQLARDPGIKLTPIHFPVKTDKKGQANFDVMTVTGKRGIFEIQPKAFAGRTAISGPKIKISIEANTNKAVSMSVEYDKSAVYTAGETMPDFKVRITSEEETLMTSAKGANLKLYMWRTDDASDDTPGVKATPYLPDPRLKDGEGGVFHFTERPVPEVSGSHNLVFIYKDSSQELISNTIVINVQPGPPVKLVPVQDTGTYTVSNTKHANSRALIRTLQMELRDKFDNPSGSDVNGRVTVEVTSKANLSEIPELDGATKTVEVSMVKGKAMLQNLLIQENTPGRDGKEYVLRCVAQSPSIPKNKPIPAYDIPFLFYNDAKKQTQMAALTKERDQLRQAVRTYKSLFDTSLQLGNELKIAVHEACKEKNRVKEELKRQNIPASQIPNITSVDSLIQQRVKQRDGLLNASRRACGLQPAPRHAEVLGKIAHLAQVRDNDVARVLSWHMSTDMDCIVTHTSKKAKEIHKDTSGKQQVLSLDMMYTRNLPDWSKPLPHIRFKPHWRPAGNPSYARAYLEFPNDPASCKTIFGSLLGETMIFDNLDSAAHYRQELVKYTHCPTILTRDGDRIRSNGKFGGNLNKAPSFEKMRGAVFGEPLPMEYHAICTQIETLQSYRTTLLKYDNANKELQEHEHHCDTPEMLAKQRECQESEEQLRDIEARLGIGHSSIQDKNRGMKKLPKAPVFEAPETPSPSKRLRTMKKSPGSATTNGNAKGDSEDNSSSTKGKSRHPTSPSKHKLATPTRSVPRRSASFTSVAETLAKRARRN